MKHLIISNKSYSLIIFLIKYLDTLTPFNSDREIQPEMNHFSSSNHDCKRRTDNLPTNFTLFHKLSAYVPQKHVWKIVTQKSFFFVELRGLFCHKRDYTVET